MGLLGSSYEDKIRMQIRDYFDQLVQKTIKEAGDTDYLILCLEVDAAINAFYESMLEQSVQENLSDKLGVDFDTILEEEFNRAKREYFK